MEWLKKLLVASAAVLAPIQMVLITVGALITIDLITGILASMKRGNPIRSAVMRRTITKMLVYQLTVISGFLLETYILGGSVPITKILGSVIGMVEFKSILENANIIADGDIIKGIISKLGSDNDIKGSRKKPNKKKR